MEKSCPGQEGHPPSRVNFSERLYEKKVDPFAEPRADRLEIMKTCGKKKNASKSAIKSVVFLRFTNVGFLYPRNSGSYGF